MYATTRRIVLAGAMAYAVLAAPSALAQRGGGGMGGPPGGGGGMGAPRSEMGQPRRGMGRESIVSRPRAPQLGLPGRWWDDRKTIKSLNLRTDQKQRMDEIFNTNKRSLQSALDNLQNEEFHYVTMSSKDLKDQTKVFAAIDRVTTARAELQKQNARIVLQIRQQMDPDQLARLDAQIAVGQPAIAQPH